MPMAIREECQNQLAKNIIQNDFYVDDLITGSQPEDELLEIQRSIRIRLL